MQVNDVVHGFKIINRERGREYEKGKYWKGSWN